MPDDDTLGAFLRSRRDRLSPADVGLPDSGRRRTPGLRREEVATLAGVSVDYVVRLEQGRDTNPSASVLTALAHALRLTREERRHLGKLATWSSTGEVCAASSEQAPTEVAPTLRTLLRSMDAVPAFIVGPYGDVLAWNDRWARLVTPMGMLEEPEPNLIRFVFTNPRARAAYPDWPRAADEQAARLRAASGLWREDPHLQALVASLTEVPAFAERWSAHDVEEKHRGTKRLVHPDVGELRIDYEVLLVQDDWAQELVTWLPHDEATATAIRKATDTDVPVSPARLRVVGEGA